MKVTDLMIGDWVMIDDIDYPNPEQIGGIKKKHGGFYAYFPRWDLLVDFEKLNPIPLTAEILEKNGFEKFADAFYGFGYVYRGINMNVHVYFFDKQMDIEVLYKDDSLSMSTLDVYVHTLQHALRLCGIDKEIEL